MTNTEALTLLDRLPFSKSFTDLQELIVCQSWEGKSYEDIAEGTGYDANYIRDVGAQVWKVFSDGLNQRINKRNFQAVVRSYLQHEPLTPQPLISSQTVQSDWGTAIEPSCFYGRTQELAWLHQSMNSQIIVVLGMAGMGKTTLSVKFAQQIASQFEFAIWRSLHHAPPVKTLLLDLLQFLSGQIVSPELAECELIQQLLACLQRSRCLILLDNVETILEDPQYRELLRRLGETRHQSCFILTSREMPGELELLEGVRSLFLRGLSVTEAKALLHHKGEFRASEADWSTFIQYYAGNPLALKMAASGIAETFDSDISEFLSFIQKSQYGFEDLNDLLDQQFDKLSNLEQEVLSVLATHQVPISFAELQGKLLCAISQQTLPNTLKSLKRRSMLENNLGTFSLQPDVMDYVRGSANSERNLGNF
ncbi:NB-ARC domain-containing protein [Leptolyngbya boryana CZ1]|uniref:NB-ARC domain-containing protein n=1 Tax=Leptolyngbya boryana CZ1 TaxID=3060204 RepID=A0AA97AU02_LEPBY|nr:NB-ARC domain-containing protein [Leptolyngbya boryana]WNZ43766.1 NB-ARC domain-containing protein [Leptolyngbya boryana CZ1]